KANGRGPIPGRAWAVWIEAAVRDAARPVGREGRFARVPGRGRDFAKQLEVRDLPSPTQVRDDSGGYRRGPDGRLHGVAHIDVVARLGAVAEDRHRLPREHPIGEDRDD